MPTPTAHALLSASSAYRWMVCTASPLFEADFPSESSFYTEEGQLAHSFCELYARKKFCGLSTRKFNSEVKRMQGDPLYQPEMLTTAEAYVQYLFEKSQTYASAPHVNLEVRVDLSDYIPEGFGTCDSIMIGGDTLHITDYKHGKGVVVSAVGNPQMRLYALGALKHYAPIYGDSIKKVSMGICQPRITDEISEDSMSVEELLAWGDEVRVKAECAYTGKGEFVPGDHCRFCRGRSKCRARANVNTALEDFKDCVPASVAEGPKDGTARVVLGLPPILSDDEIGALLVRGAGLVQWFKDLQEYALGAILQGGAIPGFKVVEGRSNRTFADENEAVQLILDAGYERNAIMEPKSLAELEKMIGRKRFAEIVGDQITKPKGKPTLVPESDQREPYNAAAADFAGVAP